MLSTMLLLGIMQLQPIVPATDTNQPPVRTETLTAAEMKAMADARQAVADAEDKLIHAKAALQGTTQGIELAHHANTDCGCYTESTGRDYDKVEFKDNTIIIHHIHEPPASLSKPATP